MQGANSCPACWSAGEDEEDTLTTLRRLFRSFEESCSFLYEPIDHPASRTHASMDPVLRKEPGITENLIRLSAGLEHIDDLLDDLGKALDTIPKSKDRALNDEWGTCKMGAQSGMHLYPD
jgi:hypothetical protein